MSNKTPKDCTAAFGDGLGVELSQRKRTPENRRALHNLGAKDFRTRRNVTEDIGGLIPTIINLQEYCFQLNSKTKILPITHIRIQNPRI